MARFFLFCTLLFGMIPNASFSQTPCTNFNQPAPAGDDCSSAPLLCGNYLDGYCSGNQNATADVNLNWNGSQCFSIENNVWLRIPPCESGISLEITPRNCQNGQGLETALFSGVCDTLSQTGDCFVLVPDLPDTVTFNNLGTSGIYWLMIDGVQGDVCEFGVRVIEGIGTGVISGSSCDCTAGSISGPTALCPGQEAEYTITAPLCSLVIDSITGGNGQACFPPAVACGENQDSSYIIWHIPDHMSFVGDSTGWTVTLQVDNAFFGIDTVYLDTIYAEIVTVFLPDTSSIDSLAFCDCTGGVSCGSSIIEPLPIVIEYHFYQDPDLTITCNNPVVFVNGQPITSAGSYTVSQDMCSTTSVNVTDNTAPPFYTSTENDNGDGTYTAVVTVQDFNTIVFGPDFFQNGFEFISLPIPCGTSYSFTVVNIETGCATTGGGSFDCAGCTQPVVNIVSLNSVANCCSPALLNVNSDQIPTQIQWQGPGGPLGNQPGAVAQQGGLYTVQVTVSGGCSAQASFMVQEDFVPPFVDAGANTSICAGEFVTLNASSGTDATVQWSTGDPTQAVQVSPLSTTVYTVTATNPANCCTQTDEVIVTVQMPEVQNIGIVGTISCANPCFDYNGQTYCSPGVYQQTDNCIQSNFEIGFQKETVEMGNAAMLTCSSPCFDFNGTTYCQTGDYTTEDACKIYHFSVTEDMNKPVASNIFHECNPSNTAYTVSFQIEGPAPYLVNGASIAGNYYTSPSIPSGSNYAYIVKSAPNGCETIVAGLHDCDFMCIAEAGIMGDQVLIGCEGIPVQGDYLGGEMLGPDDLAQFVLYTGLPLSSGTIVALNNTGQFDFLPGTMSLGQSYYISQIVGKNNGSGAIDLNDPCLDISVGQTVVFHAPPPPLEIAVENPECAGATLPEGAVQVLNPPTGVQYALDNGDFKPESLIDGIGVGTHTLVAQDAFGCKTSTDFEIITPMPAISLELGPDHYVAPGATITLEGVTDGTPATMEWSTDQGETYSGSQSWTIQFDGSRLVTLNVTNATGCVTQDEVWVYHITLDPLFQPNVFLPGSVHGNDHFTVLCGEGYLQKVDALRIYDRWGEQVFERRNFPPNQRELGWDGTKNGVGLPSDVFVYVMELELFNGEKRKVLGEVTLIR